MWKCKLGYPTQRITPHETEVHLQQDKQRQRIVANYDTDTDFLLSVSNRYLFAFWLKKKKKKGKEKK